MKNLKIFVFFLCMFTLFACSDDDDAVVEENDPVVEDAIVGKWFLEGADFDGEYMEADSCVSQSFFEFFANGYLTTISFSLYNDECEGELEDVNQWEKVGEHQYKLFYEDEDYEESYIFDITFSNEGNDLVLENHLNTIFYYTKNE